MRTGNLKRAMLAAVVVAVLTANPIFASTAGDLDISTAQVQLSAHTFTLSNGLKVVVHEDHSAPIVHVNVWYHVGSKNETIGKSGFAHLFEHLMFNGSENFNDDFFKATQKIGASNQNGTTDVDRTNYFQTVPKAALDSILWLESDRMGHLLGVIDKAKLDEQRAVVKNEKRQGDNRPYAMASDLIMRATMPAGHPYAHSTIGSMEDLDKASVEDVHQWFKSYYGPSNAVLVLAGDITLDEAKAKVQKYFGDIHPGAPASQPESWVVKRTGTVREVAYDRVANPRLYRVWNVSDYKSADTDYLQLLGQVLAGDKNSRLHKRLVLDEQLALGVSASVWNRMLGGQFMVVVDLKPGSDMAQVEGIVAEEIQRLLVTGPEDAELARVRTASVASFIRSMESISRKADLLAESQTYLKDADGWKLGFKRYEEATPIQVRMAGNTWLSDGDYVLHVLPFGDLKATSTGADRSSMPLPETIVPATFPVTERAILGNGMKVVVARRSGVPLVNMTLLFDTGVPSDFLDVRRGSGTLAMSLLDEGTTSRTGEELSDALANLGATLETGGGGETSHVSLSALKSTLRQGMEILADVVMNPCFLPSDIDRLKGQTLAAIKSGKQDPGRSASRLTSILLFGSDHPYGRLVSESDASALTREDVVGFHSRWFHPNNATLFVTGDATLSEIRPLLEEAFTKWEPAQVPDRIVPMAAKPKDSAVYLIDKPGTPQVVIRATLVAPARKEGDNIAREAFNTVLGGAFTSRLNMKLREEKGWAYGAGSSISGGRGPQVFSANASVQADKAADSMTEIATLLAEITSSRPISSRELASARDEMSLGLASAWASSAGMSSYLIDQEIYGLPSDYYSRYPGKVSALTLDAVNAEAKAVLANRPLTWVVVGDLSKVEPSIRALDLGEVRVIDADGKPVR